jgi:prepilin-type N-terminal cleavage/methylation domain-containing protein
MHVAQKQKGFGLVEVLIAASIMTVVIAAVITTTTFFLKTSIRNTSHLQAGYLIEEGTEVLKLLRDNGWDDNIGTLSLNTPYYLNWSGGVWSATTSTTTVDSIYYRTFALSPVYRDGSDDISTSGLLDSGTLKATVTVAWFDTSMQATTSKTLVTYITNLFEN